MKWVKGELLTDIDAPAIDPARQLERGTQRSLFDRKAWFSRIWRYFPQSATNPIVVRAWSEQATAWLFLVRLNTERLASLTSWYSFKFGPVFAGDPDDAKRLTLLTAIAKRLRHRDWQAAKITMAPVRRDDGTSTLLSKAFKRSGWIVFADQISTRWTANVAGLSFDQYWENRPGQLRSTFKRKRAKAAFDITIYDQFDDAAWAEYENVYADSWKPEEGSPAFVRETAIFEAQAGCLRLGICRIDGIAIAAQYWTVEGGVAHIHKLAHRESTKDLSPGTILSVALFKHVIDHDHVDLIDFGTGDDQYKADWMDAAQPLDQVRAFNPRRFGGLLGAARAQLSSLVSTRRPR
jgi:Acetyltransferase (GNAT) domain